MFCSKCGTEANGNFCWKCGAPLYDPDKDTNKASETVNPSSQSTKRLASFQKFKTTRKFNINTGELRFDDVHQMIYFYPKAGYESQFFHFSEILNVELIENDVSVFETNSGSMISRALIGSIFSPTASIIGGATAKKEQIDYVNNMYIRISLNNLSKPMVKIPIITEKVAKNYIFDNIYNLLENAIAAIQQAQLTPISDDAYEEYEEIKVYPPKSIKNNTSKSFWICSCGYKNINGITCSVCGQPKPVEHQDKVDVKDNISEEWRCPKCDNKNNGGLTCRKCGENRKITENSKKPNLLFRK